MTDPNRWYFSKEAIKNSPSRKCNIDEDKEIFLRQCAANFIQDMGQRLKVTQLCINTATVYMHRFYMFHSFSKFHRNAIAACALFLAAKVEEQPRKLEDVIKVAHWCLNQRPNRSGVQLDNKSPEFLRQANELVINENIMLQTLGFEIGIEHPHTFVVKFCQLFKASKDLAQTSYITATNSLNSTTMCLQYKPTIVACFCIHLACKWSNWVIPESSEGKPWFCYVDETVTLEMLENLTSEFLFVFEKKKKNESRNPLPYDRSLMPSSSSFSNIDKKPSSTVTQQKNDQDKYRNLSKPSSNSNDNVKQQSINNNYKMMHPQPSTSRAPNVTTTATAITSTTTDKPLNSIHRPFDNKSIVITTTDKSSNSIHRPFDNKSTSHLSSTSLSSVSKNNNSVNSNIEFHDKNNNNKNLNLVVNQQPKPSTKPQITTSSSSLTNFPNSFLSNLKNEDTNTRNSNSFMSIFKDNDPINKANTNSNNYLRSSLSNNNLNLNSNLINSQPIVPSFSQLTTNLYNNNSYSTNISSSVINPINTSITNSFNNSSSLIVDSLHAQQPNLLIGDSTVYKSSNKSKSKDKDKDYNSKHHKKHKSKDKHKNKSKDVDRDSSKHSSPEDKNSIKLIIKTKVDEKSDDNSNDEHQIEKLKIKLPKFIQSSTVDRKRKQSPRDVKDKRLKIEK